MPAKKPAKKAAAARPPLPEVSVSVNGVDQGPPTVEERPDDAHPGELVDVDAYTVVGARSVDGVAPGGTVHIGDPARSRRLYLAGHISRPPSITHDEVNP